MPVSTGTGAGDRESIQDGRLVDCREKPIVTVGRVRPELAHNWSFRQTEYTVDADFLFGDKRPTPDLHGQPANGRCAAETDVPVLQSVLALSAKIGSSR